MARIRSIKPEFPQSESLGRVSRDARLLFVLLWPICDDHGRTRAAPRMLASLLFPYDDDAPSLIGGWLDELERADCIRRYEVDGASYLYIPKWLIHQKIDKPSKPLHPNPPETLAKPREGSALEGKGREGKGSRKGAGNGELKLPSPSAAQTAAQPACLSTAKAERLAAVTTDAIAAFNSILSVKAKPEPGLLPSVHATVGHENRRKQVGRCLKVARDICQALYGNTVITPEFWREYFGQCAEDPFKSGRQAPGKGHENWQPSFEYLTRPAVMLEVFDKSGAGDAPSEEAA